MTRTSAARRFVVLHLVTVLGMLTVVGLLNFVADPFDYFRPSLEGTLDPFKKRSATRYARANVVAAGNWDVILCGASRTEIGFDPEHPVWAGRRVYNFGLVGAKYPEIWSSARFAIASNPRLNTLWVELDPSYLVHQQLAGAYLQSRYYPKARPVDYGLGQLFGSLASERSAATLSKWWDPEQTDSYYTPLGLRHRPIRPLNVIPWDWFADELDRSRLRRSAQQVAHQRASGDADSEWLDLSLLESFPELLTMARQQETQVCVVVPPAHLVRLAQFVEEQRYAQVSEFKRRLALLAGASTNLTDGRPSLVVYDFLVDDEANAEPLPTTAETDTRWHWEAQHFRVELGYRMLEQIASGRPAAPGNFGAMLKPETIEQHLSAADAALARRLPTMPIVQAHLNCQKLVQQIDRQRGRDVATLRNNARQSIR